MLSIIIVNHNSLDHLYNSLKSIYNSNLNNIKYEIIIVDNNSNKLPDQNKLIKYNVKLLLSKSNMGYSKALNYAVKHSIGIYILALNPDVVVKKNTISDLYNYYIDKNPSHPY